jgi:hypothetical protein
VLGDVFGDLLPADALLCAGAAVECGQCAGEALAALDELVVGRPAVVVDGGQAMVAGMTA